MTCKLSSKPGPCVLSIFFFSLKHLLSVQQWAHHRFVQFILYWYEQVMTEIE